MGFLDRMLSTASVWLLGGLALISPLSAETRNSDRQRQVAAGYRGPCDVVLLDDQRLAVTANQLASSISLVDLDAQRVVGEYACGGQPRGLARLPNDQLLVSCHEQGVVERFALVSADDGGRELRLVASFEVGFLPLGVASNEAGTQAFVALTASGEVAELDLRTNQLVARHAVGNWPRYLAFSPDGRRLAVGLGGDSQIAVLDTSSGEVLYKEYLSGGINLGQLACSSDGMHVYFPWMIYRTNPIDVRNIQRGWVLASRLARIRMDGPAYREAISLDVPRLAVADPHGLALTPNEHRLAITSSGTHELLVYRVNDLPFIGAGGPGDLIDPQLLRDDDLFYRIELGGRPMGVQALADDRRVVVSNYLTDTLQVVDLEERGIEFEVSLGSPPKEQRAQLVHRGRVIFHDAGRSLDQWYSCHSCHMDGGSNAKAMDTWNDGTELTTKTVLPLYHVPHTPPWTWHGWQDDLDESIQNSFTSTMQGDPVNREELESLKAYLASLRPPQNPFPTNEAVARGGELFRNPGIGCSQCHSGRYYTDGQVHDVGLGSVDDKYDGFNTPSLVGVHLKVRLLHDGRAKSLEEVLSEWHKPEEIGGGDSLSPQQLSDLAAFLRTL